MRGWSKTFVPRCLDLRQPCLVCRLIWHLQYNMTCREIIEAAQHAASADLRGTHSVGCEELGHVLNLMEHLWYDSPVSFCRKQTQADCLFWLDKCMHVTFCNCNWQYQKQCLKLSKLVRPSVTITAYPGQLQQHNTGTRLSMNPGPCGWLVWVTHEKLTKIWFDRSESLQIQVSWD
jgi:hypothetical protein